MKKNLNALLLVFTCLISCTGCAAEPNSKITAERSGLDSVLQAAHEDKFKNGPVTESTVEYHIEVPVANRVMVYTLEYGPNLGFDVEAYAGELYQEGSPVAPEVSTSKRVDLYRVAGEDGLQYLIGRNSDDYWSIWRYDSPVILEETNGTYYTSQWPDADFGPITEYEAEYLVKGK